MSAKVGPKMTENKKVQKQVDNLSKVSFFDFIGEVKSEFKKITWTSKEELQTYTKIVVAATFTFGLMVYGMDLIIQTCLSGLNGILRLVTG